MHTCVFPPGVCVLWFSTREILAVLIQGTPKQTPQECKIQITGAFFCYFLAVRSYDTKASQRRLSDSVQDADLLSLHLRMHVGREERAADHQNVGQRTMTSSLRSCDLRLHNSDPPTTTTTTTSPSATQYKPREEAASTLLLPPPPLLSQWGGGQRQARAQI